jgi:hypothetical protein
MGLTDEAALATRSSVGDGAARTEAAAAKAAKAEKVFIALGIIVGQAGLTKFSSECWSNLWEEQDVSR